MVEWSRLTVLAYHFIGSKYGLEALQDRCLKVSRIHGLNDPYELLGVDLSNHEFRQAFLSVKAENDERYGLLCFSRSWENPVMWSHYAERHQGLCLGFEIPDDRSLSVNYVRERLSPEQLFRGTEQERTKAIEKTLCTKFSHWEYEEEIRIFPVLSLLEQKGGHHFIYFSHQLDLKEVVIGIEAKRSRQGIEQALLGYERHVDLYQAKPAFKRFEVLREKLRGN